MRAALALALALALVLVVFWYWVMISKGEVGDVGVSVAQPRTKATQACDGAAGRCGGEPSAESVSRVNLEMAPSSAPMQRAACGEDGDGRCMR